MEISKVDLEIIGLDCAHCASVIEEKVNKLDYVEDASLNFITKQIKITFKTKVIKKDKIDEIAKLIDSIESGLEIKEVSYKNEKTEKSDKYFNEKFGIFRIVFGVILFITASMNDSFVVYLCAYLIFGYDVILKALRNILKGKIFDENFLMSIATIGAFFIKEYPEAVAVMLFYQIGEYFQSLAVGKSRNAIKSLMNIKAEYAVRENGEKVSPEEISIGDVIIVKPGEKVPLDGNVIDGSSFVDMSALIGESVPRKIVSGDEIFSGSINNTGVIKIKVSKVYENSTVSKILDLVENAVSKKSKAESFISKFAKIYTPIVVLIAVLLAFVPTLFFGLEFTPWLKKSLVFLVSSCPCALVVSIPLSFFSGIGTSSKRGILIKGSMYMQDLSEADTIVFDKTGTLTKGVFEISKINNFNCDEKDLIETAYLLEKFSNHPVAKAVVNYYEKNYQGAFIQNEILDFEEISGFGLRAKFKDDEILVGNFKLLNNNNINFQESEENGTIIYVSKGDKYLGNIVVSDIIKDEAKETIKLLKEIGIKNTVMLTGDREEVAQFVSNEIGIDKFYAELLPQDKVSNFQKIIQDFNSKKVIFVGDGINDAPVLVTSDVGIAMGGVGSDAAIEASDVVIMNDELKKIYESIVISRNTLKIVKSNTIFSIVIKFAVLLLAMFGITSMWMAVFADVGVSLVAILNSMRKKI